jgi:hypothetical protein
MHAASIAAVSLFGREPKFGILWSAERAEVPRGVHLADRRDRALGLVGVCCGARLGGGGTLLIGTAWSRCVAGGRSRIIRVGVRR